MSAYRVLGAIEPHAVGIESAGQHEGRPAPVTQGNPLDKPKLPEIELSKKEVLLLTSLSFRGRHLLSQKFGAVECRSGGFWSRSMSHARTHGLSDRVDQ